MTIEEKLKTMLFNDGLTESQASEVIEILKADVETDESMAQRWTDDIEGYPTQLLDALWDSTKRVALEWIDKNLPNAWYRPMFADEPVGAKVKEG